MKEEKQQQRSSLESEGGETSGLGVSYSPPPFSLSASPIQRSRDDRNNGTDRRGDRRSREEGERDRRRRIPAGGSDRREGSHFQSDWAGRAILARYLSGGGDWNIVNNPQWSAYMMGNATLKRQLRREILALARANRTASGRVGIDRTIHADMENGEGIVGYQYLHGSNGDVGDFHIGGSSRMNGNSMQMNLQFTWNDVIDPNPQYATDNWKSMVAEVITLGNADAYNIHITWSSEVTIEFDAAGNPSVMSGYPLQ